MFPLNATEPGEDGLQFLFTGNGRTIHPNMTTAIYHDRMPVRILCRKVYLKAMQNLREFKLSIRRNSRKTASAGHVEHKDLLAMDIKTDIESRRDKTYRRSVYPQPEAVHLPISVLAVFGLPPRMPSLKTVTQ